MRRGTATTRMLTGVVIAALACAVALVGPALAAAHQPRARRSIVGGQPASAGTFAWLALIVDDLPNGTAELCTGTVLSPNVVLTAGHCGEDVTTGAVDAASGFVVVTGSLDWTDAASRHVSGVSQVIVHPGYNPTTLDGGDAALLVLSTPTTAPAVRLATAADSALWQPNSSVAVAGWGKTDATDPNSIPHQLQWGTTVTQSTTYCTLQALAGGIAFDASDQLCVVDQPSFQDGTCQGDSGGPLLAAYGTATPVEVGITSFGPEDCDTHVAQFFTLGDSISSWAASWVAAVAPAPRPSPPSPLPGPSPTPSPQPTSQPDKSVARPAAGMYLGGTSQGRAAKVRVAASRTKVGSLTLGFKLHCTRHRPVSLSLSTGSFDLKGLAFSLTAVRHSNERVRITGRFNTAGSVKGTLGAAWHSRAYGTCRSGPVRWSGWTPTS